MVVEALVIVGVSFALASAVAVIVVRARRKSRQGENASDAAANEDVCVPRNRTSFEDRVAETGRRTGLEQAHERPERKAEFAAESQTRRGADEEDAIAAEQQAQRKAEAELYRIEEETRFVAERETKAEKEKTRRQAAEETRVETEREFRRKAEEEARLAAKQEAERQAEEEETRRQAAEQAWAEEERESRRRVDEEARLAAEQEAQRKAEEEARLRADEEARIAAERESSRKAEEQAQLELRESQHKVEQQTSVATTLKVSEALEDHQPNINPEEHSAASADTGADSAVRTPREYRPIARAPAASRGTARNSAQGVVRARAMPIEVRLVFERAGFCRVSLLPRRAAAMPVELTVTGSGNPPELAALQDDWYQDIDLPNLGSLLKEGIEWVGPPQEGSNTRLSLSGRELYVLAPHSEVNGFVSTPRLILGEEHVVLCTANRLSEVRAAIAMTGCADGVILDSGSGIPDGWCGLRGVVPRNPVAPSSDGNILDALKPLAEVKISLEGGIRIERQTWLSGFPPTVRLRGDKSTIGAVTIDDQEAAIGQDGGYVVPGWDAPGEHSIWCTSDSRTYAIRGAAEEWGSWNAYTWSLGESDAGDVLSRPAICGVLVRPPQAAGAGGRAIVVPASNPVLIGAVRGEIAFCTPRSDVRAGLCIGFPWFKAVWALPGDPLHCDKGSSRVLLIGSPLPVAEYKEQEGARDAIRRRRVRQEQGQRAQAWSTAILNSGRKGLETEPSQTEIATLWKTYKRFAKTRWRSRR